MQLGECGCSNSILPCLQLLIILSLDRSVYLCLCVVIIVISSCLTGCGLIAKNKLPLLLYKGKVLQKPCIAVAKGVSNACQVQNIRWKCRSADI